MEKQYLTREERAQKLLENPNTHILRVNDNHFQMKSLATNRVYDITIKFNKWSCTCPDHKYRMVECKHIKAIQISIKIKEEARQRSRVTINPISTTECLFCHGTNIKKFGIRKNKSGDIQRFICSDCTKTFSINIGFEGMRSSPKIITSALQLYFTGESLRGIQKFLRLQGANVNHTTIYKWVKKYTNLMQTYLDNIIPQVGDTWRADEVYVKVKGDPKYLFALMDDETRFWIAQEVADSKFKHDARNLLRMGKEKMQTKPNVFVTDGLFAYNDAFKKEYGAVKKGSPIHVRHISLHGDRNNNKMERLNGEFRDREKIVRGVKSKESPIFDGYQIYHNYFRPHMALDGKTPAEACGIQINGDNKWITVIQNASKK